MSNVSPEQQAAFLADLQALHEKHGIILDSCGCCGSPWLESAIAMQCFVDGRGQVMWRKTQNETATEESK